MIRGGKYLKFLMHILCVLMTVHIINNSSLNYKTMKKVERFLPDIKHILIWSDLYEIKEEGQKHFINKNCKHINCYFTTNRTLFGDVRYFDAVIFKQQDLGSLDLPEARGKNQKYIFAANDSADNYPVCSPVYDEFFNWTWTYRFESTIRHKLITVYNQHGEELGSHFRWQRNMAPIDRNFQSLLTTKSRAAAVFLDKCKTRSNREGFIDNLKREMSKYNMTLDIFGDCSQKKCKRRTMNSCEWRLRKQYLFFLAMEDSLSMDFVTKEVLLAYKNNVVPIVYGGADYSKFLPPGSYLNAIELGVETLAKAMYEAIQKRRIYEDFFRYRTYYRITEGPVLDACALCEKLNNPLWLLGRSSYTMFRKWWHPEYEERCYEGAGL